MKISSRGRYGLRAMLELACAPNGKPVLMSDVAKRQGLSRKYLHTLLTALRKGGLVRSARGVGGGFTLAKPTEDIRLREILVALEGPLALVDCLSDEQICGKSGDCTSQQVWRDLNETIERALDSVTLRDMLPAVQDDGERPWGDHKCGTKEIEEEQVAGVVEAVDAVENVVVHEG